MKSTAKPIAKKTQATKPAAVKAKTPVSTKKTAEPALSAPATKSQLIEQI